MVGFARSNMLKKSAAIGYTTAGAHTVDDSESIACSERGTPASSSLETCWTSQQVSAEDNAEELNYFASGCSTLAYCIPVEWHHYQHRGNKQAYHIHGLQVNDARVGDVLSVNAGYTCKYATLIINIPAANEYASVRIWH